jgi:hydrocephalus-inducing protein
VLKFTNPVTNEYLFYNFTLTTSAAEILETLGMESPVRQTARTVISLDNPLNAALPVGMGKAGDGSNWWTCDNRYIRVNELSGLAGNSEGSFEIEFRPLAITPQPVEAIVTILTKELGAYSYKLVLKSTPPTLRQLLRFDVSLGAIQSEVFVFKAFNANKIDFNATVTRPDVFAINKLISVEAVKNGWDGDDVKVPISFEPTEIGEVRDVLTLTSADGGTYTCELIAVCSAALPAGPFNLSCGGKLDIPFRNCFSASCNWNFSVDSSAFTIASPTATVNAKTQGTVSITFAPKEEHRNVAGGVVSAKLFVTCASKPEVPSWVFYLRGKIEEEYFLQAQSGGKKK